MPLLPHNFHGYPRKYSKFHLADDVMHFMSVKIGDSAGQRLTMPPKRRLKNDLKLKKT